MLLDGALDMGPRGGRMTVAQMAGESKVDPPGRKARLRWLGGGGPRGEGLTAAQGGRRASKLGPQGEKQEHARGAEAAQTL